MWAPSCGMPLEIGRGRENFFFFFVPQWEMFLFFKMLCLFSEIVPYFSSSGLTVLVVLQQKKQVQTNWKK